MPRRIQYQNNNRDSIEIIREDDGSTTMRVTHGIHWREWKATNGEIPNINNFLGGLENLAEEMIGQLGL